MMRRDKVRVIDAILQIVHFVFVWGFVIGPHGPLTWYIPNRSNFGINFFRHRCAFGAEHENGRRDEIGLRRLKRGSLLRA